MNAASILHVLVKAEGLEQASRSLKRFDDDARKTSTSSDRMAASVERAGATMRKMGDGASSTRGKVGGLTDSVEKAAKAVDLYQDAQGRWRRSNGQFATDADKAAAGLKNFTSAANGGRGGLNNLKKTVDGLGGGFGPLMGSALALAPALTAASASAIALTSALAPLVGLGPAAAVGLGALGQAAGVAALALMGVGDALKEQMEVAGKAGKLAVSSADQQRGAARAIAQAQEGVRAAQLGVRDATLALADAEAGRAAALKALGPAQEQARRSLEDMHASLASAALNEQGAVQRLEGARADLARVMSPVDAEKLASAQERLTSSTWNEQKAVQGLIAAKQRLDELMTPPDALTMADAQDAVADATRGQERATLNLLKAQQDLARVTRDPKMSDEDRAEAKLALADAENAIGDASRQSTKAQQQLAKLQAGPDQQKVADAKQDIADAERSVAEASKESAKAQQAVADAQQASDPLETARAKLEVAAAEQALADSTRERVRLQQDVFDADQAGVSGSAEVVAAKERIAEADRSVTDAQRRLSEANRDVAKSMQALKDAQSDARSGMAATAIAAQDLNEKFNELPPAAQTFVRALQALKPKFDDLRATAAAGLFPGVTSGIQAAMQNFDPFKRVVELTAKALGGLAEKAGELVGSKGFGKDIETIGGRNVLIIERLGNAAISIGNALRHIMVAAGPLTTWLAKVAEGWADNVEKATEAGRESGKLADFFQSTKDTLKVVGSILGNLASAFFNVGKAAAPSGRDILATFDNITEKFKDWTKSFEGQNSLKKFFDSAHTVMGAIMPVIGNILKDFGELAFFVLPAFLALMEKLGPLAGPVIQALIAFKAAATVAKGLSAVAAFANPIGLVVLAIAALGAAFVIAYKRSETFREIVNKVWGSVQEYAKAAVKGVKKWIGEHQDDLDAAKDALRNLGKAAKWAFEEILLPVVERVLPVIQKYIETVFKMIGGALNVVIGLLTGDFSRAWDGVKQIVGAVVGYITTVVGALAGAAWDAAKALGGAIADGLKAGLGVLWDAVKGVFEALWDAVLGFFGVASPSKLFMELGGFLVDGLVAGLKAGARALADAAKWLADTLVKGVKAMAGAIRDAGKWVLEQIVEGFKAVTAGVAAAGGWLKNRFVEAVQAYADAVRGIGTWLLDRIVDGFKVVTNLLGTVGGWLKNRVVEFIKLEVDGLTAAGSWIVDKVVAGFKTVTEALSGVGTWLMEKIVGLFEKGKGVAEGFKGLGGTIIDWIISGLKNGAFALQGFLNKIIGLVNKIPGVDIPEIKALTKDKDGNVKGFARGGAFARTGGVVDRPITLMGEEAPRFAEYVIPTNPAYRKRAQGLAMQAASAVGLAQGGVYGGSDLQDLWKSANPGQGDPKVMAAIALAESSGRLGAIGRDPGGTLGLGLWQITTGFNDDLIAKYGGQNAMLTNARANADAAGDLLARQGLGAWVVYNTGKYKEFLDGGGIVSKIGDALGGAFDLLKNGASALLGNLPGTDGLGWLKGLGDFTLGKVGSWIKDKASSVVGLGGDIPGGVSGSVQDAIKLAMSLGFGHPSVSQLTGGKHAPDSWHYKGRAADFGAAGRSVADMTSLFNALLKKFGSNLKELFYDPIGFYVKNGQRVSGAIGGHMDHLHVALAQGGMFGGLPFAGSYANGGIIPGPIGAPAMAMVHGGEKVTPPGRGDAPLVWIENATFRDEQDVETMARSLDWKLAAR